MKASAHDRGIVNSLLLDLSVGRGEGLVADINFGEGDLDTGSGELLEDGGQAVGAADRADDEVTLETNAVDGRAGTLDQVDNGEGFCELGARVLDALVAC